MKNQQNIFCNLESRNFVNKTVPKVVKEDGSIINKQEDILKEIQLFYSNLYKRYGRDANLNGKDILNTLQGSKLSFEEKINLEGDMLEEEVLFVFKKKMENNKSPGSDGYSAK